MYNGIGDFKDRAGGYVTKKLSRWGEKNITYDIKNGVASFIFWSIPFAPMELYLGKSLGEVTTIRVSAAAAHVFVGKYTQPARRWLARKVRAYDDSPWLKKQLVNCGAVGVVQPFVYGAILGGTAVLNNDSLDEFYRTIKTNMPRGWVLALAFSPVFGAYMDHVWRMKDDTFPKRPVQFIDEEELSFPKRPVQFIDGEEVKDVRNAKSGLEAKIEDTTVS